MTEFTSENREFNPMHDYMEEIERNSRLPRNGDVVTGEVIRVTENAISVALGCKRDGVIPKNEIALEDGQTVSDAFSVGDEIQAKVLKGDDGDGNILLSTKRIVVGEHWDVISKACEDRTPVEVKVIREVSGGVIANCDEVSGFIPMSQLSDRFVEADEVKEFVGKDLTVKVIRVDQRRNKVVFSHKAYLHDERQKRLEEIWDNFAIGDVIPGKVVRFAEYGAFVDIGGVDGLLHISEISWGKLQHPSDMLSLGQEIQVKILAMDKEREKISLGYKQNNPEPWSLMGDKYKVGATVTGKVVQLKEYGAFIELEPGLDGLVHISEVADHRVETVGDELQIGQVVTAKVRELDQERRRISLSIRDAIVDGEGSAKKAEAAEEEPVEVPAEEPAKEEAEAPAEEAPDESAD